VSQDQFGERLMECTVEAMDTEFMFIAEAIGR